MDSQVLPGNRVLIAEAGGGRVTERDFSGNSFCGRGGQLAPTWRTQGKDRRHMHVKADCLKREGQDVVILTQPFDFFEFPW